ncbi:MAG: arginine repressor [Clostridia bacterium]|nr:arginine repressor [Clostridia bacterium]
MKNTRQEKILEIIKSQPIFTQDDLQNALKKFGFEITQSTISRDIRELKLVKAHDENGNYCYAAPEKNKNRNISNYKQIIFGAVDTVQYAQNNVVIKCHTGMAQSVCVAIDGAFSEMMIGTIAGDDTILAITRNENDSVFLVEKIKEMM